MSQKAEVDVDALFHFISTLKSFNSELESRWSALKSSWQASSESWRDIKKEQFTGAVGWDEVVRMMEGYLSTSENYTSYLQGLHERASAYLEG